MQTTKIRIRKLMFAALVCAAACHSYRPVTGPSQTAVPQAMAATTTRRIRVQSNVGDVTTVYSPVVRNDSLIGEVRDFVPSAPFGIALANIRRVEYETVSAGKTVALTLFVGVPLAAMGLLLLALSGLGG